MRQGQAGTLESNDAVITVAEAPAGSGIIIDLESSVKAAYGDTICAERTAAVKAVSSGHRDFVRIAIAGRSDDYCVPCGTCRQVMMEFAPQMEVICINKAGDAKKFALKELLPYGFDQTWL